MAKISSMQKGLEDPAWIKVMEILNMSFVPLALRVAIRLNVIEILASENSELSAKEILACMKAKYKLSISNPTADNALDRILCLLASQGVLSSSLQLEGDRQLQVRKFGLTDVSRYLVSGCEGAPSLVDFSMLGFHKVIIGSWAFLEQAIIEGGEPFTLAHGKNIFLLKQEDPQFDKIFNSAMTNQTILFSPFLLQSYHGFLDINTLVDVGGGTGAALHAIVSKYPHIKGINFDQPHVIARAPLYSGVEYVGGDMFESIPKGETIFMKWILHNWSDELCVKILKNCYKALPTQGKVIIVDVILSPEVGTSSRDHVKYTLDMCMFTYLQGGKERTEEELQEIVSASGFGKIQLITQVNEFSVIEIYKI